MIKISQQWLQQWLDIELPTEKLVDQLTMAGLEVDAFEPVSGIFSQVIVGEVIKIEPHPNASKLHICQVNIGEEALLTIVCGASNVHENMKVAVAVIGATIPGMTIEKVRLRGVESEGMLCSEKELGLAEASDGIMELPSEALIGQDLRDYLQLNDTTITVELTSNRGDCASIRGIAREVATVNRCQYLELKIDPVKPVIQDTFPIILVDPEACPRYVGRIIRNVNMQAKTPLWMQECLRRSGSHSIHPIVDVTNYVMLELGQPMHAFDFTKLSGEIQVRFARTGEKLVLLDGTEVNLNENTLVIADNENAVAIAGIMGGKLSGITEETQDIFLESAFFNPVHIVNRPRQYGLQTDSSYRFEHGVDPQLQMMAMERATQLLLDIVGGEPGPLLEVKDEKSLPKKLTVDLRFEKIERLSGLAIPKEGVYDILTRLGMQIDDKDQEIWKIQVPSYRFDISIEEDFVEEVERIYGYNNFPATSVQARLDVMPIQEDYHQYRRICSLLQDRGYHEVISYSFIDPKDQQLLDSNEKPVLLVNPMIQDMSVMRTNLWPGLIKILLYNLNRQQDRVRLFETGLRFRYINNEVIQEEVLSGLVYGSVYPEQWGETKRAIDFFDVKRDLELIFSLTEQPELFEFRSEPCHNALHPGQSAALFLKDKLIGHIGMLHPQIVQEREIKGTVCIFEILLDAVKETKKPSFSGVSKFPTIRRDISLLVDQDISAKTIQAEIQKEVGESLIDVVIFDIYHGQHIEKNKKSIALGLTLQHSERTLQDKEADEMIERIMGVLERRLNIKLRK